MIFIMIQKDNGAIFFSGPHPSRDLAAERAEEMFQNEKWWIVDTEGEPTVYDELGR